MNNTTRDRRGPSRRTYLQSLGALAAGALAGCTSSTSTPESDGGAYSVTLAPMGEIEFDDVPNDVFTIYPQYVDMAVALGHGDAINSMFATEMAGTTMNHYYEHLDGVSFEWDNLTNPLSGEFSRELVYEQESDLHLADPAWVVTQSNWDQSKVKSIGDQLGPWFGNFYSGTHDDPPEAYRDQYEYYSLWELFGKVAQVFDETERYEAIKSIYDDTLATITKNLPPESERPTAVRVTYSAQTDQFFTYHLNKPGYWLADTRPLGATDAFADQDWEQLWGTVDYETMLEADPDVILHLWGLTPRDDMAEVRSQLENDASGQKLTAVQNDRVYAAGMRYQGPIMNLFQLEMGAKQLYPEQFGEWPGTPDGGSAYPEIPEGERLFDRQELADVINGS
ncbi:ferrichrome-binding protein [Natronoarchaeum philippinense]|uniref:Ferrichrome-binding protein n=1 Tax=Natronoarchaeum philippinense TaxID=558529 RepID=A0A285NA10_NATPI|nr:ABC transporter substrate-binding protein [Natronoarchaeum philippinense]SNZ05747.1 ferrichrome-binding protein [Natronoarchaeum philippinense]